MPSVPQNTGQENLLHVCQFFQELLIFNWSIHHWRRRFSCNCLRHSSNDNGWLDGSYNLAAGGANGANPERRHQLMVDGDARDSVIDGSGGWTLEGQVSYSGHLDDVYNQGMVQLLINHNVRQDLFGVT